MSQEHVFQTEKIIDINNNEYEVIPEVKKLIVIFLFSFILLKFF